MCDTAEVLLLDESKAPSRKNCAFAKYFSKELLVLTKDTDFS